MVIIYNQIRNNVFAKHERAEGRLCVAAHHMAALLRWAGSADNNFNERDLGGDTQTRSSRGGKYK